MPPRTDESIIRRAIEAQRRLVRAAELMPPRNARKRTRPPLPPRTHDVDLRALPALIARQEALGHPVIVDRAPGTLKPHEERLYATLGVLVRFVEPPRTEK